eukprot:5490817-Pyramimonas_sp.AAC.2
MSARGARRGALWSSRPLIKAFKSDLYTALAYIPLLRAVQKYIPEGHVLRARAGKTKVQAKLKMTDGFI